MAEDAKYQPWSIPDEYLPYRRMRYQLTTPLGVRLTWPMSMRLEIPHIPGLARPVVLPGTEGEE